MKLNNLKFMLLTGILLMDILAGMEFDLFVPSFPGLQAQFHLTPYWFYCDCPFVVVWGGEAVENVKRN